MESISILAVRTKNEAGWNGAKRYKCSPEQGVSWLTLLWQGWGVWRGEGCIQGDHLNLHNKPKEGEPNCKGGLMQLPPRDEQTQFLCVHLQVKGFLSCIVQLNRS